MILELVPEEDRGLFLTNIGSYELKVLLAYLRVNLFFFPLDAAKVEAQVASIPELVRTQFFHLPRDARVLVFLAPPEAGKQVEWMAIRAALLEVGQPYRGQDWVVDISDHAWGL